jgi:NADPH-dependent 7-cyano-7-deazaguanine reductase QueF
MKNPNQDSRSPGRDFNPGPPEYETGVLTTRPRRSATNIILDRQLKSSCPRCYYPDFLDHIMQQFGQCSRGICSSYINSLKSYRQCNSYFASTSVVFACDWLSCC